MREFLDTYAALILRIARAELRRGPQSLPARDVAREAIESLLRLNRQGAFEPSTLPQPEAYLRVVVRRAAQRAERAELHSSDLDKTEELTGDALVARQTLTAIEQKLRPREAAAFALLVEDGLTIEETALALGTTPNNVREMRRRALAAARELGGAESEARVAVAGLR
jgi:RNA polymerase sigma factor (sigma-70 family)